MTFKKPTLVNLQIARFFAALSVAMVHIQHEIPKAKLLGYEQFSKMLWFPWGVGVDVFFVISGFVMILASAKLTGGSADASNFFRRRLERVTPMYWIFSALALSATAVTNERAELAFYHIIASFLYIPLPDPTGQINPILGVGWTINYEMFFYALFSVSLMWPIRKSRVILISTISGLVLLGWLATDLPQPLSYWTRPILLEFLVGCGLGLMCLRRVEFGSVLSVLLIAVAFSMLFVASSQGIAEGQVYRWWCLGIPASMIVAALAFSRQLEDRGLAKLFHRLGDASYALYLVHPFIIIGSAVAWKKLHIPSVGGFVLFALILSVSCAWFVHLFVEKPLLAILKDTPYSFFKVRDVSKKV